MNNAYDLGYLFFAPMISNFVIWFDEQVKCDHLQNIWFCARTHWGMTQQDVADITGILPSNIARLESGGRVPTLVVLQKYAAAVGKHINGS